MIEIAPAAAPTRDVRLLVAELEAALAANYPAEQRHGLAIEAIFQPHVRFFTASVEGAPAGCGGLALFDGWAEVKRMYVRPALRGRGVAQAVLARIEAEARGAGAQWLRLETGDRQAAAIRLYERAGFRACDPFGDYARMTPHEISSSLFYEKQLQRGG